MQIVEYLDSQGESPFARWFERLDPVAAAKVTIALGRMEQGNLSNVKSVGTGIHEYRLNYGPGYRIYFGFDGQTLVILLAGGSKSRQHNDIEAARRRWLDYRKRKTS